MVLITLLARNAADRRERDERRPWTIGIIPEISVLGGLRLTHPFGEFSGLITPPPLIR